MKPLTNIVTALVTLSLCNIVCAQNKSTADEPLTWYQVELLVFANNNLQDASQENWSQELGLKYPQRIVQLKNATHEEGLFNHDVLTNDPFSSADNANSVDQASTEKMFIEAQTNTSTNPLTLDPVNATDSPTTPTATLESQEEAFLLLAKDQLQLTDIANRIFAQADFRPLFHGAWRQPVNNRSESESILIQGGEQFDKHFELEGSIKLSVERYLHIQTDLWLSQFISNIGLEQTLWPILPSPPVTTQSNRDKGYSTATTNANSFNSSDFNNNDEAIFSTSGFENPFNDLIGNLFSVEQTVAIRQHRRMRSNELHYIDHPLVGLLIKVTPYEPPTPNEDPNRVDAANPLDEQANQSQ